MGECPELLAPQHMSRLNKVISRDGILRLRAVPDEMDYSLQKVDVTLALRRRDTCKSCRLLYR